MKRGRAQSWKARREEALRDGFRALAPQQIAEKLVTLEERERALLLAATPPERPAAMAAELKRLRTRLAQLQDSRPFRLRDAFFGARIPDEERHLAREIQDMEHAARQADDAAAERVSRARSELAEVRASIRAAKAVRRERSDERIRAQAAAYRGGAREPANALRRRAPTPDRCPYCQSATSEWELDHIHPVSKGGLSVDANCVMVCADCNGSKGATLLRHFCRARGWDFETVAARLEAMGKEV